MHGHAGEDHRRDGDAERIWRCSSESARWCTNTSLCGLGQTAPNPVFSTLRYFRDEYCAHIEQQRLHAGRLQHAPSKDVGGGRMTTADVQIKTLTDRRPRCGRARGPDHSGSRAGERNLHSDSLPSSMASQKSAPAGCAWWRSKGIRKLLPACVTSVQEGMEVIVNSRAADRLSARDSRIAVQPSAITSARYA